MAVARALDRDHPWRLRLHEALLTGDRKALDDLRAEMAGRDISALGYLLLSRAFFESGAREEYTQVLEDALR